MSGAESARVSTGYESDQGGALRLIVSDDEYVVASRQNAPFLADLNVASVLSTSIMTRVDLSAYPNVSAYWHMCWLCHLGFHIAY